VYIVVKTLLHDVSAFHHQGVQIPQLKSTTGDIILLQYMVKDVYCIHKINLEIMIKNVMYTLNRVYNIITIIAGVTVLLEVTLYSSIC
jgi:hypothetical protein